MKQRRINATLTIAALALSTLLILTALPLTGTTAVRPMQAASGQNVEHVGQIGRTEPPTFTGIWTPTPVAADTTVVTDKNADGLLVENQSYTHTTEGEQGCLDPQHSGASFCNTTEVKIWVNATGFKAGQIKLTYNSTCADVTDWVPNTTDFPLWTWDSATSGEEWITFLSLELMTGDYLIGTLTIHCESEEGCTTDLDFVEDGAMTTKLFDDWGNEVPATWEDGTFECTGTPTPPPIPVGGVIVQVNKFELLAPWMGMSMLISIAVVIAVMIIRRKV